MFSVNIYDIKTTTAIFKERAFCVVLPGEEEEFSILDFHQSVVSCLKEGIVKIDGKHSIHIKKGIARMDNNELSILIEKA